MFSLNGTLKKGGSVGRWKTKQFIGMALTSLSRFADQFCYILVRLHFVAIFIRFCVSILPLRRHRASTSFLHSPRYCATHLASFQIMHLGLGSRRGEGGGTECPQPFSLKRLKLVQSNLVQ